jgi:acyl-CoA dehydrogenase
MQAVFSTDTNFLGEALVRRFPGAGPRDDTKSSLCLFSVRRMRMLRLNRNVDPTQRDMMRTRLSLDFDALRPQSPFWDETHRAWQSSVRRFVEREIVPHIGEWEMARRIPRALFKTAASAGIIGAGSPAAYGGWQDGHDIHHAMILSEELARGGAGGVVAALMVHGIGLPPVLAAGSDALKAEIAPLVLSGEKQISLAITEPGAGSDVANIATRAVRDGDDYIVNGEKTYITGGMTSHYASIAVRTGGPGLGGISLLVIDLDAPGITRRELAKQGWHASDTASLTFRDVRVPTTRRLGEENGGFGAIMHNFNGERIGMSAQALAYARVCLADAIDWARTRQTFGKRLADHQVIRHKIADLVARIRSTTVWLDHCAWRIARGGTPVADLALLKVQATTTMEACAREAMQILGGASYMEGSRIERIYREVRVMAIGGGSEEIMRDLAARQLDL